MPFRNLAGEYTATTGTSDVILTGAVGGYNTFELAGITNGEVVRYRITTYDLNNNRPTHSEDGIGAYNTATNTLARTTVESSTNAGAKITLTGLSVVVCTATRKDFPVLAVYYGSGIAANDATSNTLLDISTEWTDEQGIATLASDVITLTYDMWVRLSATVTLTSATAFNGKVNFTLGGVAIDYARGYTTAMGILADTIVLGPSMWQASATNTINIVVDNALGSTVTFTIEDVTIDGRLR